MPLARYEPRRDRLPAGGLLAQHRDVHVAEIGQRQGARDRRRGHDQDVDRLALGAEREALVHAETVLLVDDRKPEIVERRPRPGTAHACRPRCRCCPRRARPATVRRSAPRSRPVRSAIRKPAPHGERARYARNAGGPGSRSAPSARPGGPASMALAMARSPTAVLPEPTSPWSRRSMRLSATRSRRISATASACEAVSAKGRARRIAATRRPSPAFDPPRQAPHAAAHEGEGELGGEELVIGEPPPRRRALRAPPR